MSILSFETSMVKKPRSRKTIDRTQIKVLSMFLNAAYDLDIYQCKDQIIDLNNIEIEIKNTQKTIDNNTMEIIF